MAEEKKRGDRLTQLGPAPEAKDVPLSDSVEQIVMGVRGTIGVQTFEAGALLAEVRLATGVTLGQLLSAIRNGVAAKERPPQTDE